MELQKNKDDLIAMSEVFYTAAKEILLKDQYHEPLFIIESERGLTVIKSQMRVEEEKDIAASVIRAIVTKYNATSVFMVSEIWFGHYESLEAANDQPLPSEREDRREALLVLGQNRQGQTATRSGELIRDEDGNIAEIVDFDFALENDAISGRFAELFEPFDAGVDIEPFLEFISKDSQIEHYQKNYEGKIITHH